LIHPGGKKALRNYVYKDISKILFTIYPHSSSTLSTLNQYAIGFDSTYLKKNSQKDKSPKKGSLKA
jgi:hypothetical protein